MFDDLIENDKWEWEKLINGVLKVVKFDDLQKGDIFRSTKYPDNEWKALRNIFDKDGIVSIVCTLT